MKLSLKEHIQRSREAVAANKAKGNKHAELFATMYTQPSRFIEEILQNTEDAYSRKNADELLSAIRFKLFPDKIEIHHNGKDFDENDLMSITTFANTTKKNNTEVNLIGKFGIGFKSVFSITDFPEIHCGSYHYKITDYEVLTPCETKQADEGFRTLILLPFKRKGTIECYNAVKQGLDELNSFHLLFLKKLNRIEVYDQNILLTSIERNTIRLRKLIEKRTIQKRSFINGNTENVETFLVHTTEGRNQKKLPELAFKVQEIKGIYIFEPIVDAPLFVYFPLKMYPGLSFLIHAPFTTNPLRDFALFDSDNCPENIQMLNDSVRSYVMALSEFKKMGFYSIDLLARLFIKQPEKDAADHQKFIIQESFFRAFSEHLTSGDNIPLGNERFAKIQKVLIPVDESIYHLLNGSDLVRLFQKSAFIDSAICSEKMSDFRNFLSNDLGIKVVDAESFGFRIKVTSGFLEGKSIKWLKDFYKYLHSQQKLWDVHHADLYYSLRRSPVILTSKNHFESAFDIDNRAKVFLPGRKKELLAVVHPKLLQDEFCVSFFNDLGIKQADLIADVFFNIIPQFRQITSFTNKDYYKRLEKIFAAYAETSQKDRAKLIDVLRDISWLKCHDESGNSMFSMPGNVYLKNEYLVQYFKSYPGIRFIDPLVYAKLNKNDPAITEDFIKDIGLVDVPRISDEDKQPIIEGFDNFLSHIDFARSKAFAKILIFASEDYFQEEVLQFIRKQKWVYTKKGNLAAPENMNITDIAGKYRFNETEKTRFQILMGMTSGKHYADVPDVFWHPQFKPEEINLNQFINFNEAPTSFKGDITLLNSIQANLNFFEPNDVEIKEFSASELEEIDQWSQDFLLRVLKQEFPEPEFKLESSQMADFVVFKNGMIFRYIFACCKTDLMNHFYFTMGKFINICKLIDSQECTFLYCINSVGTSSVSISQFQNPFEMFQNEKIRIKGSLFLITD